MYSTTTVAKAKKFHGYFDDEFGVRPSRVVETHETKYIIIQERELSYRFYLHQHPYVQQLMLRLLRKGTAGLQAADTDYTPGEVSLPFGVDFELEGGIDTSIPTGSSIRLLNKVIATDAANVPVELAPKDEFKLAEDAPAKLFAGTRATFVQPLAPTPYPRVKFTLEAARSAINSNDTPIKLTAITKLTLADGTTASIPADTEILLIARTSFEVPSGTEVTLLRRRMRPTKDLYGEFFEATYKPDQALVTQPYPVKDLDFTSSGAYSVYNWELFFHVPFTIAIHLSKNQRFAEAQRWFHYLFDPTDDSEGPTPERFWKVRPFQYTDVQKIEEILVNLVTGADETLRNETIQSIEAWKDAPFRPHVIARYRQQAYMIKTVMAYLDNLIAWGDSLFRQDTGEAIDEALQVYVLAANILGPRPQPVPKKGTVRPQTYANLRQDLSQFGTLMRDMEAALPYDLMPFPGDSGGDNERLASLRSLGKALYFCVPRNDKLLSYWDTVADRLFKIRNSLNIQGVFRQLALFEPPIDPAMLARAAAAGLDITAIVNGLNQPLPLVRFQLLVQKAAEIVQEVTSLGNNLLAAMEKEDGEAMAILRARHERVVMEMVEHVKYGQLQEAIKSREGLLKSLALAVQRYTYYERQLGKKADEIEKAIPELGELDKDSLDKMKFAMQEPEVGLREIEVDIATDIAAQAAQALNGGKLLSSHEVRESLLLEGAQLSSDIANILNTISSAIHVIVSRNVSKCDISAFYTLCDGQPQGANYDALEAVGKRRRQCLSDQIVSRIDIGVNDPPVRCPEQAPGHPLTQIDRMLANGFQVQKRALASVRLFLINDLDPGKLGLVGQHLDKAGVGQLDEVLVVTVAQLGFLLPEIVLADDQCPDPLGDQPVHNPPTGDVQIVVDPTVTDPTQTTDPGRGITVRREAGLQLSFTLVVEMIVGFGGATVNNERLKARLICSYRCTVRILRHQALFEEIVSGTPVLLIPARRSNGQGQILALFTPI
jgi:hypothetical protein